MPDLTMILQFSEPRAEAPFAEVEIKTSGGPAITTTGTLYPNQMAMVLDILEVLKKHRDIYPAARRPRPNSEPDSTETASRPDEV